MSLINYKDIDFNQSTNKENKTINFNNSEIQIVNYLSANDKYDLIMITLQKAFDKNIYNSFKLDIYLELHIIYMYTNIVFSAEERADEILLYDTLKKSGLINLVINEIKDEFDILKDYLYAISDTIMCYRNTFGTVVGGFIDQLPELAKKAEEVLSVLNPELLTLISKTQTDKNTNI